MIAVGLVLLLIGAADLLRARRRSVPPAVAIVVVWTVILVAAGTGLGTSFAEIAVALVVAAAWLLTTSTSEGVAPRIGLWPVGVLAIVTAALTLLPIRSSEPEGYLVMWLADGSPGIITGLPIATLVLGLGVGLFLVESSNVIVRAALYREPELPDGEGDPVRTSASGRSRWTRAWRRSAAGSAETEPIRIPDLKGGRLIGPLERLIIVAVVLSGSFTVVGALVAAKGIVRFPEISKDQEGGSKAEYFLVGSLVSWAIAIAASVLLSVSADS